MAVLGIDIGGSGIKGAPVNTLRGSLLDARFRLGTPTGRRPDEVVDAVAEGVRHFDWKGALGLTFPGVVTAGTICTAANLHKSWIGVDLPALVLERVQRNATVINDADAAGVAEVAHGAAKGVAGVVLVLTFGTGVGSAVFLDGKLVPNTELGHLELDGEDAETQIGEAARERKSLSWKKWAKRANRYLVHVEGLLWPDLIVVGGGIAKKPDEWLPLLNSRAPLKVAALGN